MIQKELIGYIAGIVDGEGSVFLQNEGKTKRPYIVVTNSHLPLLQKLKDVCGGSIIDKTRFICDDDCDESHYHQRKQVYQWRITGEKAAIVLRSISPFMIEKRELAEDTISFWENTSQTKKLGVIKKCRNEMKVLGWNNESQDDSCTRHSSH